MDLRDLHDEVLERANDVINLTAPQIEGWVSGLFALWSSDDDALAFLERCSAADRSVAGVIGAAVAELADGAVAAAAGRLASEMRAFVPEQVEYIGTAQAMAAWEVRAPFGRSLVVGCRSAGPDNDHALLVELDRGGAIVDLQLAGSPEGLLDVDQGDSLSLEVVDRPLAEVVDTIVEAWRTTAAGGPLDAGAIGPGMAANHRFVRRRIERAASVELRALEIASPEPDLTRGMTDQQIAEADTAARSTLRAALGDPADDAPVASGWVEVVHGSVDAISARERDALLWLEWADWLGAGIGLVRAGLGTEVSGETLVDHVNRCPEVSSTIPAADRDYAVWAFDTAIEHLIDQGLVDQGRLTEVGLASLHQSLVHAWSGHR